MPVCVRCGKDVEHLTEKVNIIKKRPSASSSSKPTPQTNIHQDNVVLSNCKFCNKPADKYIEYELILILLDVMLHKISAVRHLLFNRSLYGLEVNKLLWKLCFFSMVLTSYQHFRLVRFDGREEQLKLSVDTNVFYSILICTTLQYVLYAASIYISTMVYWKLHQGKRGAGITNEGGCYKKHVVMGILMTCVVHLAFIPMVVWGWTLPGIIIINIFFVSIGCLITMATSNASLLDSFIMVAIANVLRIGFALFVKEYLLQDYNLYFLL